MFWELGLSLFLFLEYCHYLWNLVSLFRENSLNSLWSTKVRAHLVQSELFASFYVSVLHVWIVIKKYINKINWTPGMDHWGQRLLEPLCPHWATKSWWWSYCNLLYKLSWGTRKHTGTFCAHWLRLVMWTVVMMITITIIFFSICCWWLFWRNYMLTTIAMMMVVVVVTNLSLALPLALVLLPHTVSWWVSLEILVLWSCSRLQLP